MHTLNHHFLIGLCCDLCNVIRKPSYIVTMEAQSSFKPGFERYLQTMLYVKYGNLVTILTERKKTKVCHTHGNSRMTQVTGL